MVALQPVAPTTVGSFPRPAWLAVRNLVTGRAEMEFSVHGDLRREAQDDATLLAIREQESAGLELISDGEQRRTSFINHVLASWDGIDLTMLHDKGIRRRDVLRKVPTVVGNVRRREAAVVEDLRFLKGNTDRPVKMTVPGPTTVVDTTYDQAYGDETALAMDVASALNAELLELQAAGADVIQIDEPAMTRWHEEVAEYGAEALDRTLEGVSVPTIVHLCYGYAGGAGSQYHFTYPELLDMLMETRISGFSLEFARSGYDWPVLKHCEGRIVMLGCIDPSDTPPEPVADVAARARAALD